jgi:hypothetical protein
MIHLMTCSFSRELLSEDSLDDVSFLLRPFHWELCMMTCPLSKDLIARSFTRRRISSLGIDVVVVVDVVKVVMAEGCLEASKSYLACLEQKSLPSRVASPPV